MKTEFNVERVCERVHLCVVDAPDELGQPQIEVRGGSIYVSFPEPAQCDAMAELPDHGGAEQAGISAVHEEAASPAKATGGHDTIPIGPFVASEIAKITSKRKGR